MLLQRGSVFRPFNCFTGSSHFDLDYSFNSSLSLIYYNYDHIYHDIIVHKAKFHQLLVEFILIRMKGVQYLPLSSAGSSKMYNLAQNATYHQVSKFGIFIGLMPVDFTIYQDKTKGSQQFSGSRLLRTYTCDKSVNSCQ